MFSGSNMKLMKTIKEWYLVIILILLIMPCIIYFFSILFGLATGRIETVPFSESILGQIIK